MYRQTTIFTAAEATTKTNFSAAENDPVPKVFPFSGGAKERSQTSPQLLRSHLSLGWREVTTK